MAGGLDFGSLPPEVNSGLMYSGAGSGPLIDAANAWAGLASELDSAASACAEVVSGLTSGAWHGRAAASMVAAAAPYAAWMRATAGHAAVAASNAAAAAAAYQRAFAATVPPPVVATNRVQLAALTATNLLGQNAPAIAKVEAAYAVMWAQDATAMYGYAAQSAAAAALNPLTAPPATTTATGLANQSAATADAAATAAASSQTTLSQMLSALPNTLQTLAGPAASWNIFDPANADSTLGLSGLFNLLAGTTDSALGSFANSELISSIFSGGLMNPQGFFLDIQAFGWMAIYASQDYIRDLMVTGGMDAASLAGSAPNLTGLGALAGAHTGGAVAASAGKASLVGALSAPQSWTASTAPALTTATAGSAPPAAAPVAMPLITTGVPRFRAGRADRTQEAPDDNPSYGAAPTNDGIPTKSLTTRTPAGG